MDMKLLEKNNGQTKVHGGPDPWLPMEMPNNMTAEMQ